MSRNIPPSPETPPHDPSPHPETSPSKPRFLRLSDVAGVLNISANQVYALVRNGDLPAIKIGGRGQWRVEASILEEYIQRMYADTREFVTKHPLGATPHDQEL